MRQGDKWLAFASCHMSTYASLRNSASTPGWRPIRLSKIRLTSPPRVSGHQARPPADVATHAGRMYVPAARRENEVHTRTVVRKDCHRWALNIIKWAAAVALELSAFGMQLGDVFLPRMVQINLACGLTSAGGSEPLLCIAVVEGIHESHNRTKMGLCERGVTEMLSRTDDAHFVQKIAHSIRRRLFFSESLPGLGDAPDTPCERPLPLPTAVSPVSPALESDTLSSQAELNVSDSMDKVWGSSLVKQGSQVQPKFVQSSERVVRHCSRARS